MSDMQTQKTVTSSSPTETLYSSVQDLPNNRLYRGTSDSFNSSDSPSFNSLLSLTNPSITTLERGFSREEPFSEPWLNHPKHYFICSAAGKPIYSRYGDESQLSSFMGLLQTFISHYQDNDRDSLKSIVAGQHLHIVFLIREPLYFVGVTRNASGSSSSQASSAQMRRELKALHYQMIALLSKSQIEKVLEERKNYDLRQWLNGSEYIFDKMISLVDSKSLDGPHMSYLLKSIEMFPLEKKYRDKLSKIHSHFASKMALFSFLVAHNHIIVHAYISPLASNPQKKGTCQVGLTFTYADFLALLNFVSCQSAYEIGNEVWSPFCCPQYYPKAFMNVYATYLKPGLSLILLTDRRDAFPQISKMKRDLVEEFNKARVLNELHLLTLAPKWTLKENWSAPGLVHFVYKNTKLNQCMMPRIEKSLDESYSARLCQLYQNSYDKTHERKDMTLDSLLLYTEEEMCYTETGPDYELYIVLDLGYPKNDIHALIVQPLLHWIKKSKSRFFIDLNG